MSGYDDHALAPLDVGLLVDGIVRSTMVLIGQITLGTGRRSTLGHIADQVFGALARELRREGLSPKVIADMFGMALRTYHERVNRLSKSGTLRDRTIWEAVFEFLARQRRAVTREAVFSAFPRDDERVLRAILKDLERSGLAFRTGRGAQSRYRLVPGSTEIGNVETDSEARDEALVRLAVYRNSPTDRDRLAEFLGTDPNRIAPVLERLHAQGRIERDETPEGTRWRCEQYNGPYGDPAGFEAALFDHYRSMVQAMCLKLRRGQRCSNTADTVGGSTYTFQVRPGHPMEQEVLRVLSRVRQDMSALWDRVESHNEAEPIPDEERIEVVFYCGQSVRDPQVRGG